MVDDSRRKNAFNEHNVLLVHPWRGYGTIYLPISHFQIKFQSWISKTSIKNKKTEIWMKIN